MLYFVLGVVSECFIDFGVLGLVAWLPVLLCRRLQMPGDLLHGSVDCPCNCCALDDGLVLLIDRSMDVQTGPICAFLTHVLHTMGLCVQQ